MHPPFPQAPVVDPKNNEDAPENMKSRRTGKLYLGGYTVKGEVYRREFERTERRIRRDRRAKWGDWVVSQERTTGWERKESRTDQTHKLAFVQWTPWTSVSCQRGTTRDASFFDEELLAMAPVFEVFSDKAGEYRFRLKAANGEIVAASDGYSRKASAFDGVHAVIRAASLADVIEVGLRRKARKPTARAKKKTARSTKKTKAAKKAAKKTKTTKKTRKKQ